MIDRSQLEEFEQHLFGLIELAPARSYEDVPIQIGLWPFLKLEDGGLVVSGTRQKREGYRWGMSSAWDQTSPHYMLPSSHLVLFPPKTPLYVSGAQMVDYIYTPRQLTETLAKNRLVRQAISDTGISVEPIKVWPNRARILEIYREQYFVVPIGVAARFEMLLHFFDELPRSSAVCQGLFRDGQLIGYAMIWYSKNTETFFFTHRAIVQEYRSLMRYFYWCSCTLAMTFQAKEINMGDALGVPGLASFKLEMKPSRIQSYVNVLDFEEALPHV
jgi:hypothetical protein